jgi:hypothetical protein
LKIVTFSKFRGNGDKMADEEVMSALLEAVRSFQQNSILKNYFIRLSCNINPTVFDHKKRVIHRTELVPEMQSPIGTIDLNLIENADKYIILRVTM